MRDREERCEREREFTRVPSRAEPSAKDGEASDRLLVHGGMENTSSLS